jgi:glycosyltransferase involved in cell wall biosynthesis
MKEWPKISVVVATYNRRQYLKRMLDNLIKDDYPNIEIVVVDGGSSDGTVELLKSYQDKISSWISEPDHGEYNAYNKGLKMAKGEIIKPMSDDDILRPEAFRRAAEYFIKYPNIGIVFGQTAIWQEKDGERTLENITQMNDPLRLSKYNWLRAKQEVRSMAAFIQSWVFEWIGYLAEEYACGDMEFWLRAASNNIPMGTIPDIIIDYHYTGENTVTKKKKQIARDMVSITAKYGNVLDVVSVAWRFTGQPYLLRIKKRILRISLLHLRKIS